MLMSQSTHWGDKSSRSIDLVLTEAPPSNSRMIPGVKKITGMTGNTVTPKHRAGLFYNVDVVDSFTR